MNNMNDQSLNNNLPQHNHSVNEIANNNDSMNNANSTQSIETISLNPKLDSKHD
jgi:hypothetical protein